MAAASVPIGINPNSNDQLQFLTELKDRLEAGFNKPGEFVKMSSEDIVRVCNIVKVIIRDEPTLLTIESPLYVLGDIHGQFYDLLRIFRKIGETDYPFLFLGDYVDRGPQSVEVIIYLFVLKGLYPTKYYLLRGNHEDLAMCSRYGFKKEVKDKFEDESCFFDFMDAFNCMPIAAVVDETVFCVHGGLCQPALSPEFTDVGQIFESVERPTTVSGSSLVFGLLWSDPIPDGDNATSATFEKSHRGDKLKRMPETVTEDVINHEHKR
ncbi:hypothetical protein Aperf_G00000098451 [Anoplocephala perfoliata]